MLGQFLGGARLGALAAVLLLGLSNQAQAEKVGVAAAVNPDAFSSLAGAPKVQLNIGKSIFFNERINTDTSGLVQVLLVDGSTFTVGPGSDLVINRFVYDPKKGTGEIAASFSKGAMRFVGGKISKRDNAVSIETPAGSLAVRGCIILGNIVSATNYGFVCVYCDYMKMNDLKVYHNGYGFFSNNGNTQIALATQKIIDGMMAGLNPPGQNTGGTDTTSIRPGPNYTNVDTISLQDLVADRMQDVIGATLNSVPTTNNPDSVPTTNNPDSVPTTNNPAPTTDGGEVPPPPIPGGYAAGVVNSVSDQGFTNVVAGELPQDFVRSTDQVSTTMVLRDVQGFDPATTRYQISFTNDIATAASVFNVNADETEFQYAISSATGNLINSAAAQFRGANGSVTPAPALCSNCDFLQLGAFATTVEFSENADSWQFLDPINGWWVSGNLASAAEIDDLWASNATASYSGNVLATVINNSRIYDARGDLAMGWNFGARSGDLTVSNFDGNRTFGTGEGNLTQVPGPSANQFDNQFRGPLSGSGLTGSATGSFVRGPDSPAQGVIGDFNVGGDAYKATGVFAGTQTPD